jgi:hypothetical protein
MDYDGLTLTIGGNPSTSGSSTLTEANKACSSNSFRRNSLCRLNKEDIFVDDFSSTSVTPLRCKKILVIQKARKKPQKFMTKIRP